MILRPHFAVGTPSSDEQEHGLHLFGPEALGFVHAELVLPGESSPLLRGQSKLKNLAKWGALVRFHRPLENTIRLFQIVA